VSVVKSFSWSENLLSIKIEGRFACQYNYDNPSRSPNANLLILLTLSLLIVTLAPTLIWFTLQEKDFTVSLSHADIVGWDEGSA